MLMCDVMCDAQKIMSVTDNIYQFFVDHECTYNDVEVILDYLCGIIEEQRRLYEYDTYTDYHVRHKTRSADNVKLTLANNADTDDTDDTDE